MNAPRQRPKSFNAVVAAASNGTELDPDGPLIDADQGKESEKARISLAVA
jgi:hypothetical protein